MSGGRNRFDLPSADAPAGAPELRRRSGPMGAAGREVGENVASATEAQVETRRRNAADAREFREAREAGRVLSVLPLAEVRTDGLPRDRLDLDGVAAAEEMEELKASIRARGQREPIEVYVDDAGRYQLKKGWRRLSALRALFQETGEARFETVVARVASAGEGRVALYVDMVEENAVRQDLTFAEMAAVAIKAAADPAAELASVDEAVARLYGSLQRTKRSYIRQFAALLEAVGDALTHPKSIGRDLGVEAARALRARPGIVGPLRARLAAAETAEAQNAALAWAVEARAEPEPEADAPTPAVEERGRRKYEFHHAAVKVTARDGECRIKGDTDFASIPRARLEAAVAAFLQRLGEGG
jgi:ParB family chromosome partitioning protein